MTHVTCRQTAKNRDQLRNPTLGNRVWATFLYSVYLYRCLSYCTAWYIHSARRRRDAALCGNVKRHNVLRHTHIGLSPAASKHANALSRPIIDGCPLTLVCLVSRPPVKQPSLPVSDAQWRDTVPSPQCRPRRVSVSFRPLQNSPGVIKCYAV